VEPAYFGDEVRETINWTCNVIQEHKFRIGTGAIH
jgi:hypothetical protein